MNDHETAPPEIHRVRLADGTEFPCRSDEKVLIAMERAHLKTIQVGCRGGGCGACRVLIVSGGVERLRMGKNHVDDAEAARGYALSCRILPKSDLVLELAPKAVPEAQPPED